MIHNPTSYWLTPAQRLVRDIADFYGQYMARIATGVSPPSRELQRDLTALLRAAHELERQSFRAAADSCTEPADLLRALSPIRSYGALVEEDLEDAAGATLRIRLRGILSAAEQLGILLRGRDPEPPPARSCCAPGRLRLVGANPQALWVLRRAISDAGHRLEWAHDTSEPEADTLEADRPDAHADADGLRTEAEPERLAPDLILLYVGDADWGQQQLCACRQQGFAVLVLAPATSQRELGRWLELGADDCIGLPLDPALLQLRIQVMLERKRWQDRERQLRRRLERNQRFVRDVFGRYLSPEIVDNLLERPEGLALGGAQRTVTVLLADIRGFTRVCERLAPDRVMQLLNIYLGTMAEIVLAAQGTVDEFIGDAVLAIFGAPLSRHDDADRALQCALDMQQAVHEINARNAAEQLPPIEIGIAINTGRVVAGNVGSELRSKYAVVGHAVNQTARIEEICPGGTVLASAATLRALQRKVCIAARRLLRARGMAEPIEVFEVVSMAPAPCHRR